MIKVIFRYLSYFLALAGFAGIISVNLFNLAAKRDREDILTNQKLIIFELGQKATKQDIVEIRGTLPNLVGAVGQQIAKDSASKKQDVVDFYNLFRKEFQVESVREQDARQENIDTAKYVPRVLIQKTDAKRKP